MISGKPLNVSISAGKALGSAVRIKFLKTTFTRETVVMTAFEFWHSKSYAIQYGHYLEPGHIISIRKLRKLAPATTRQNIAAALPKKISAKNEKSSHSNVISTLLLYIDIWSQYLLPRGRLCKDW